MKDKIKNVTIMKFEDYYMVCNNDIYYKVGLIEGEIISDFINDKTNEDICLKRKITLEELQFYVQVFENNGIIGKVHKEKFNLLYMRLPLIDIDVQIENVCKWLKSRKIITYLLLVLFWGNLVFGFFTLAFNSDRLLNTRILQLSAWEYLAVYGIYLGTIFFHEIGHALMCKLMGGKVGKIGIAFIVFNPAMYCDISSVRMLKEKWKQVLCSVAGFLVNMFFIGVFSIFFLVSDNSFWGLIIVLNVVTIAINTIPFIRLDGYWILSFALGIQNLQSKSREMLVQFIKRRKIVGCKNIFILVYGVLNTLVMTYFCCKFALWILNVLFALK